MNRRSFLVTAGLGALATRGVQAMQNSAEQLFPLGYNTYCLRALRWSDAQLLDYAAAQKLDAIFLQDSLDPAAMEESHWRDIREQARKLNLRLETGGGGLWTAKGEAAFDETVATLRQHIRRALALGSPFVRCVIAGNRAALPKGDIPRVQDYVLKIVNAVRSQLNSAGLRIAFEIHKDLQAWEYRQLIEAASPFLAGSYLDTGNPVFVMEDPMTTLEELGRYALTVHLRDSVVYETKRGIAVQWVPLGEGIIDFKAFLRRLAEITTAVKSDVCVHIKPITGRPAEILPVHDRDFWAQYPKARAHELARFIALAKRGEPYDKPMVVEDLAGRKTPDYFVSAIQHQQREHMERSLDYAKRELGLGRRWRKA